MSTIPSPSNPSARFVTGSLMRHIAVMAGTGAVGLVAIFAVDLISLLYISMLGDQAMTAAVGFASVVVGFLISVMIGLSIGITAVVSRSIGAGRMDDARAVATSSLLICAAASFVIAAVALLFITPILQALGARDVVLALARRFLWITLPATPFLAVGIACSTLLRCAGHARQSMMVTLLPAGVIAVLDPIFILWLGLGLDGAAVVLVIARVALLGMGLYGAWYLHGLVAPPALGRLRDDTARLMAVAGPAVLTNLATPVGAAYVTHSVAQFGAQAVAGQTTIERLVPVAFGLIYSLSGSVGPVLSQNLGAGRYDRVRGGLRASMLFMALAVAGAWLLLALLQYPIIAVFSLSGVAADMVHAFCAWIAGSFLFMGAQFVSNAAFNNLGRPLWSTAFNWGRATLGTIPFAWWGAQYGPVQVLAGQAFGAVLFGSLAMFVALRLAGGLRPDSHR